MTKHSSPNQPNQLLLRGNEAFRAGNLEQARQYYRKALALAPEHPDCWINMCLLHRQLGELDKSLEYVTRAYELQPDNPLVLSNMGSVLGALYRHEEAVAFHARAVARQPNNPGMARNHLQALREAGRFEEFLQRSRAFLERYPDDMAVRWFEAQALFYLERYPEAWAAHEKRQQMARIIKALPAGVPLWRGENLAGKSILVMDEQGFGDSILGSRYIPLLAAQGAEVTVLCRPALHELFADLPAHITSELPPSARYDYAVAMMSLPGWFGTDPSREAPPPPSNLRMASTLPAEIKASLDAGGDKLRVGIVWSGNPAFKRNAQRAVRLAEFVPLASVPGVQLYSLQKGPLEAELINAQLDNLILPIGRYLEDFSQTARVIDTLDLIIMTDTAVAHLAGSLNRPVWNLLDSCPYWIYGLTGPTTPLYPSMRLFRQPRPGDWAHVFAEVEENLREQAKDHAGRR